MKMKYYNIQEAPLKFHTFYRYVSMPLGVITAILAVFSNIAAMDNFFYLFDIAFSLVQAVCCAVAFVGFFSWKSYAWYATVINLANSALYALTVALISIAFGTDQIAYSIGSFIGTTGVSFLIFVYYYHRKPLFFGESAPTEKDIAFVLPSRVCPNCGAPATEQKNFCSECGSSLS